VAVCHSHMTNEGHPSSVIDMQYFQIFYFLQGLMGFKDSLYIQVSITLHYFIFGLGFIQIFYIIFSQYLVSCMWYLIFVYVILNIVALLFSIIYEHLWKYLATFLFRLWFPSKSWSLPLAIDQSFSINVCPDSAIMIMAVLTSSKCLWLCIKAHRSLV
jgi:hypothetical protein